jgi:hypothetical protein
LAEKHGKIMKLISTEKVYLQTDREGTYEEYVLIDIQVQKDTQNKKYDFIVKDFVLLNKDEPNESTTVCHNRAGAPVYKSYSRTYEEFDEQTAFLATIFPNEDDLSASEYQDYLMMKGFIFQLEQAPIYGVEFVPR